MKHDLAQITVVSHGGRQDYLDYLPQVPFPLISRANVGMSYGAWDEGWKAYPDFDYFIFLEDDYVFVRDHFELAMVEMFEYWSNLDSCGGCSYVCSYTREPNHPAISNGITSGAILRQMGGVPGAAAMTYQEAEHYGQIGWGKAGQRVKNPLSNNGFMVRDMGHRFQAPFADMNEGVVWYYPNAPELLIVPAQIYPEYVP